MKRYILSERVNLYEPNVYIQFYVQIMGDFSVKDMEEAVKKAYAANETTMCKIVLEKSGAVYYEKMKGSECRVQTATEEFREIIREEEKKPFEIEHGEFMRVFIIPSEKDMGVLIMAHHLVGDGKSIIYFIEDVMSALEGESLDEKPMKLITRESFPEKSELPLGIKLFVRGFNKKWKKKGCTFTWKDYYAVHEAYWKKHDSQVLCRTFCKEELESIKQNAKKAGVSVNSLIRQKDNCSMSNQVTGISVEHRYTDKNTFAENAGKVHKKIYKSLKKQIKSILFYGLFQSLYQH